MLQEEKLMTNPKKNKSLLVSKFFEKLNSLDNEYIKQKHSEFIKNGVVKFENLLTKELLEELKLECIYISQAHGKNKLLNMSNTGNTLRKMRTVSQKKLLELSEIIPKLYESVDIKKFLTKIAGENVNEVPYEGEKYVISNLLLKGDTHGWHWDDYSFAFVLFLKAPGMEEGALLQLCGGGQWDKDHPEIDATLLKSTIKSHFFREGDGYMLKASDYLHCVTPLRADAERLIVNMTWSSDDDLNIKKTHETNDILFNN